MQLIERNSSSPIETFQSSTNYISDSGYSWNNTRVFNDEFTLKVSMTFMQFWRGYATIVSEQKRQFVVRGPVRILLETSGSRKLYLSSWICVSSLRKGKIIEYTLHYFFLVFIFFQAVKIPLFQHDEEKYSPTTVRCNIGLRYSTKNRDIEIILENFNVSVRRISKISLCTGFISRNV